MGNRNNLDRQQLISTKMRPTLATKGYRKSHRRLARRVIVSGLPRSGTSWVAKALSFAPGFTYYREPDNYDHVKGAYPYFGHLYLRAGDHDPAYAQHMQRSLDGQVATPFTMKENPGPLFRRLPQSWSEPLGRQFPLLYCRKRHRLVKLVRSNLTLAWLSEQYPEALQVHVVRHPCGVFASWKRNGWEPQPDQLLKNDRLVEDYLWPYVTTIQRAQTFWERAGALWGALYVVIERQLAAHPDWLLVQHEWLCQAPTANFHNLYAALNLTWNQRTEAAVERLNRPAAPNSNPYSLKRVASQEIDKWKQQLTMNEIAECRRIIEAFEISYYPSFETTVTNPGWLASLSVANGSL